MAVTDWTVQNKASSTDNFSVETKTKFSNGPTWESMDGSSSISDEWEDLTAHYWEWLVWTFSGKAATRDSD